MRTARAIAVLLLALTLPSALLVPAAAASTPKISARLTSRIGADGRGTLQYLFITVGGVQRKCAHPGHKSFPINKPGYASKGDVFACSGLGLGIALHGASAYAIFNVGARKYDCEAAMTYGRFKRDGHTYGYIKLVCR